MNAIKVLAVILSTLTGVAAAQAAHTEAFDGLATKADVDALSAKVDKLLAAIGDADDLPADANAVVGDTTMPTAASVAAASTDAAAVTGATAGAAWGNPAA